MNVGQPNNNISYGESDGLPLDALFGILLLFQLENMLIEVELQVLVGVVDTQLFETVLLLLCHIVVVVI